MVEFDCGEQVSKVQSQRRQFQRDTFERHVERTADMVLLCEISVTDWEDSLLDRPVQNRPKTDVPRTDPSKTDLTQRGRALIGLSLSE